MTEPTAVVVTGGSSGLGAGTVKRFASEGHVVHTFDLRPAVHQNFEGAENVVFHAVDVRNDEKVRAAFEEVGRSGRRLSVIVHCAGIAAFGPGNPGQLVDARTLEPVDNFETVRNVLDTNVLGSFSVLRHGGALMARNGRHPERENGAIILTSSGAAIDGKAGQSAYSASKSAIVGMTLPLAREYGSLGIRVVTIAPGLFDTPILDNTPKLERHVPYPNRVGDPDEYARLALHITQNSYINAEVIRIDGGIRGEFRSTEPFIR